MESPEMPKYASSSRKRQLKKDNTKRSGATKTKKRRVDASVASSTINPSPQHQEPQDGLSSGDIAEKLGSAPRQKSKDGALQGITSDTTCSSQPTSLISESPSSLMTDSVVSKQMSLNQSSSSTFPSSIKPPSFSQHLTPKGYIPVPGPSVADTTPINLHLPPKPNASLIDLRTPDEQSKLSRPNIKLLYEGSPILLDTPVSQSISKRTDSDPLAQHSLTSCNTLGTHSGSRQSEGPSLTESFSLADGSISLKEGDKVNETGLSSSHRDDFPGTSNTRQIESVETPYVDQSNLFFEDQLLNELGLPSSFRDNLRSDGRFDDPAGSSSDPLNEAPDAQVVSPAISNDVTVEGVVAPEIVSRVTSNSSTASESFLIDSDEEDQPLQLSAQPSSSAPISLTALERQRRRRARIDAASASRAPARPLTVVEDLDASVVDLTAEDDDVQIGEIRQVTPPRRQLSGSDIRTVFANNVLGILHRFAPYEMTTGFVPMPPGPGGSRRRQAFIQRAIPIPPPDPEPADPARLKCAICLSTPDATTPLSSTICGHIFCEGCLSASIKNAGKKCPTCRKSISGKNTVHRLYL